MLNILRAWMPLRRQDERDPENKMQMKRIENAWTTFGRRPVNLLILSEESKRSKLGKTTIFMYSRR